MMKTLVIDRVGTRLQVESGTLVVRLADKQQGRRIGMANIDAIICHADTELSTRVLYELADHGIQLTCIGGRQEKVAVCHGIKTDKMSQYRLLQARFMQAPDSNLEIAQKIVQSRILGQMALIRLLGKLRPANKYSTVQGSLRMALLRERAERTDRIDSLLGIEGTASRIFFQSYGQAFAPALSFSGRNRRPPRDPVNALLSLASTLQHGLAQAALLEVGLDPGIGVYHVTNNERASLACDLQEMQRHRIEYWIWTLFSQQLLRPNHFSTRSSACMLGKAGRAIFYQQWFNRVPLWRAQLRRHAIAFRTFITDSSLP
jgi:CRISPR-associated protein Cas1